MWSLKRLISVQFSLPSWCHFHDALTCVQAQGARICKGWKQFLCPCCITFFIDYVSKTSTFQCWTELPQLNPPELCSRTRSAVFPPAETVTKFCFVTFLPCFSSVPLVSPCRGTLAELPRKPTADWKHSSLRRNVFYSWARPSPGLSRSAHFNSLSLEST